MELPVKLTPEEEAELLLVKGEKPLRLMDEEGMQRHLVEFMQRRGLKTQKLLAEEMGVEESQVQSMISGKPKQKNGDPYPIKKKQIARMNELDPEYELVQVVALIPKKKSKR